MHTRYKTFLGRSQANLDERCQLKMGVDGSTLPSLLDQDDEVRKTTPLAEPTTQLLGIRTLVAHAITCNCCVILLLCSAGHIEGSVVECIKLQAVCKSDHSTVVIVVAIASCLQATFHFVIVIPSCLICWPHIRFTS